MRISRFVESNSVTSSASVLDFVTIWCLHESASAGPASPIIRHAPVCDFPSGCTPYAASKYPYATMPCGATGWIYMIYMVFSLFLFHPSVPVYAMHIRIPTVYSIHAPLGVALDWRIHSLPSTSVCIHTSNL